MLGGGVGRVMGVGRHPAREPLTAIPPPTPTVLTEAGQPCRFPFRYGGRMLHSCTAEGSAHRKWWVPAPPCPPWRPSRPLPSTLPTPA